MKPYIQIFAAFFYLAASAQKNTERGDKYFNQNVFDEAIKCYQMDIKAHNSKVAEYAMQKLADCYRITGEFEKAEVMYKKVLKKRKNKKNPECILNYALSLKNSAKYSEASEQFREYVQLKPEDRMGNVYLASCDSAQKWLDETIGKEVKNIEAINSNKSDFSPFLLSNGELYFTSSRNGGTEPIISFNGGNEVERTDIYKTAIGSLSGQDKKGIVNFKGLNSSGHDGVMCFTHKGDEVYFTKTVKGKRDENSNIVLSTLQIFYSRMDSSKKWSRPVSAFNYNSTNYSTGHPTLSKNDSVMYFMSDKPGGYGKTDIYYSVKQQNGEWGPPVNAGKEVNTFGYELFPYISESNELFFASNAHPGMGQLDLFKSCFAEGKWTLVKNLKPPINSIGNDFGMILDYSGSRGFFSSDRFNGKGQEDIYSFSGESPIEIFVKNDTVDFIDNSIFDDVKYKLKPDTSESLVEIRPVNGVFSVKLKNGSPCKVVAKKNGFTYNTFLFTLTADSIGGNYKIVLFSESKAYDLKARITTASSAANSIQFIRPEAEQTTKADMYPVNHVFRINNVLLPQQNYSILIERPN